MHGGAAGSGAPRGNQNAVTHGLYTKQAIAERQRVADLILESRELIDQLKLGALGKGSTR